MEHRLDVSKLEPPEPMEQIIDALADMPEDDWLRVHHRREPYPLYNMLSQAGYRWMTVCHAIDDFEILIWRADLEPPPDITKHRGNSAS